MLKEQFTSKHCLQTSVWKQQQATKDFLIFCIFFIFWGENFVFSFKRLKFKRASFCCLFAFFGSKSSIFSFSLSSLSAPKLVINITLFWDESVLEYLGDVDEDSLDLLEHERELFGLVLATIKL